MPQSPNYAGVEFRITATGTIAIVNKASATGVSPGRIEVLGILAHATAGATAANIMLFATATATATNQALTGLIVFPSGAVSYLRVPVWSPSGLGAIVSAGNNPDLTIFWNPAD